MQVGTFARAAVATTIGLCSLTTIAAVAATPFPAPHAAAAYGHDDMGLHRGRRLRGGTHIFRPGPKGNHGRFARPDSPNGPFTYHGGTLIQRMKVYVVYWQWNNDPYNEANYVTNFVRDVGGSSWLENDTQYHDNNNVFITNNAQFEQGVWYDNVDQMPHDPQLSDFMAEALAAQQHFLGKYDPNAVYVIATPSGAQDPNGGRGFPKSLCSEHSWTYADQLGKEGVPFINLPYQPDAMNYGTNCYAYVEGGILDGVGVSLGHELAETQTNPVNLGGWWAPDSDPGVLIDEVGDMCVGQGYEQLFLLSGVYAVQDLWDNQSGVCSFYLPKKWSNVAIGGTGQIWGLDQTNYPGGHAIYTFSPPNYPPNFYSVIGFASSIAGDPSGVSWIVRNKKLYYYSATDGFHLVTSPPALQVSVGTDGGIWLLGAKPLKGGGHLIYEKGGALGYGSFAALSGIKALNVSAQPFGLGLAVDAQGNLRQYNPNLFSWSYLHAPGQAHQVIGSDAAQATYLLAGPMNGSNYTLYQYDVNQQSYSSLGFYGTHIGVGPNGDPWDITSPGWLYHLENGNWRNF